MSLDATAIGKIEQLTREASGNLLEIDGRKFSTVALHDPIKEQKLPQALEVETLDSLAEYLHSSVGTEDRAHLKALMAHVSDPNTVEVWGELHGKDKAQRTKLIQAVNKPLLDPSLNHELAIEPALVWLRTRFAETPDRNAAIALLSHVVVNDEILTTDNGLSQEVTVRNGVVRVGKETLPTVLELQPFATFLEVDQPIVEYGIRFTATNRGVLVQFFPLDGGAWRLPTLVRIADYLKGKVPTGVTVIR